jgi:hypothetical protein
VRLAKYIETLVAAEEGAAATSLVCGGTILVVAHQKVGKTIQSVVTRAQMAGVQVVLMIVDSKL